jgi:hypothetical protein
MPYSGMMRRAALERTGVSGKRNASREEHKPRVFEKRALTRIFGPKKDGVKGGWR